MAQQPIVLSEIKNKEDLKKVLTFLDEQGFNVRNVQYPSDYNLHDKKIDSIINNANKLHLDIDNSNKRKLIDDLSKIENYSDMVKTADRYFSKFSNKDKITEVLNLFYILYDDRARVPTHNSPNVKDIVEWFNFKTKYNITDNYTDAVEYFNLDKNYLKIHFNDSKSWEFDKVYNIIYGEKNKDYNKAHTGVWQDLGKFEIKFFLKGGANIKGDITVFKDYYYTYLTNKRNYYTTNIIKYNGKTEIISQNTAE